MSASTAAVAAWAASDVIILLAEDEPPGRLVNGRKRYAIPFVVINNIRGLAESPSWLPTVDVSGARACTQSEFIVKAWADVGGAQQDRSITDPPMEEEIMGAAAATLTSDSVDVDVTPIHGEGWRVSISHAERSNPFALLGFITPVMLRRVEV